MESSLAYHEPSILTIIILTSFLLLLNTVNLCLDKLVYCGLIGQVLLGVAWGTPGAQWLSREVEVSVVQLGYLGLLLLVYEGGLATSFKSLKANLLLSVGVAITGIAVPMGLSFILLSMIGASPLQAFASGAALCSTSLGTTFTILGTSGLSATRLGVVLTSAAMMDDVVGLIMVQIISNLGSGSFEAVTVLRPILVSIGFAVVAPLFCKFVVLPITLHINAKCEHGGTPWLRRFFEWEHTALVVQTIILVGLIIGATYAGTSGLFAAYIAGATVSWWDSEVPHYHVTSGDTTTTADATASSTDTAAMAASRGADATAGHATQQSRDGVSIYDKYYSQAVEHVLKPFFFASIGFSIPITQMFNGSIVWRGLVYSILMTVGKIVCGLWLVSYVSPMQSFQKLATKLFATGKWHSSKLAPGVQCATAVETSTSSPGSGDEDARHESREHPIPLEDRTAATPTVPSVRNATPDPEMPVSLYPACILGSAMVARGEIGFLISALAESNGIFRQKSEDPGQPSMIFLVVTWAIVLCTVCGPICVGLLVNRVKKLEERRPSNGKRSVLGAWGVD